MPEPNLVAAIAARELRKMGLKAVVKEMVERTPPRPGRKYLLVDADYVERLAEMVNAEVGSRDRRMG